MDAKLGTDCGELNKSLANPQDVQEADSSTSHSKPKITWHIPKQVQPLMLATHPHKPIAEECIPQSQANETVVAVTSTVVETSGHFPFSLSTDQVSSTTDTKTAAAAASDACSSQSTTADLQAPRAEVGNADISSSSSSDSSSDSDSDSEDGNASSKKIVIAIDGEIPKQLMMRCAIKVVKLNIPIPSDLSDYDSEPEIPLYINNRKETVARPLSKRKPVPSSLLKPLPKIRSAKALENDSMAADDEPDVLDILTHCQNCRVLVVDCMRGRENSELMTGYQSDSSGSDETEVKKERKRKKKKKHKKSEKSKRSKMEVEDDVPEKPSRTKNRKHKVRGEKKRVLIADDDSSDDAQKSAADLLRQQQQPKTKEELMSRAEKVRLLAEKAGMKTQSKGEVKTVEQPKSVEPMKKDKESPKKSYLNPWSEAIATSGIPKIPKLQKQGKETVRRDQGYSSSNTISQPTHNPYERVLKREARRREFEKMAAAKYGGKSTGASAGSSVTTPNSTLAAGTSTAGTPARNRTPSTSGSVKSSSHTATPTYTPPTPLVPIPRPPIPGAGKNFAHELDSRNEPMMPIPKNEHNMPPAVIPQSSRRSLLPDPEPLPSTPSLNVDTASSGAKKALLPEPKGLLPSPKSLLPDPKITVDSNPFQAAVHDRYNEFVDELLDEADWNIISRPTEPVNKAPQRLSQNDFSDRHSVSSLGSGSHHSYGRKSHSSKPLGDNQHTDKQERRSECFSSGDAQSPDGPDHNVNQDVLDEICRLSLEISKRIAKQSDKNDTHGQHSETSIPLPPLPTAPRPPAEEPPRLPTPPPILAPPPLPPPLVPQDLRRDEFYPEAGAFMDDDYAQDCYPGSSYDRTEQHYEEESTHFTHRPSVPQHNSFIDDDYDTLDVDFARQHPSGYDSYPENAHRAPMPQAAYAQDQRYHDPVFDNRAGLARDRYGLPVVNSDSDNNAQMNSDHVHNSKDVPCDEDKTNGSPQAVPMELDDSDNDNEKKDTVALPEQSRQPVTLAPDTSAPNPALANAAVPILSKITKTLSAINSLVNNAKKTGVTKSQMTGKPLKGKSALLSSSKDRKDAKKASDSAAKPVEPLKERQIMSTSSNHSDNMLNRPNLTSEPQQRKRIQVAQWLSTVDETAKFVDELEESSQKQSLDDVPLDELQSRLDHLRSLVGKNNESTSLPTPAIDNAAVSTSAAEHSNTGDKFTLTPALQQFLASINKTDDKVEQSAPPAAADMDAVPDHAAYAHDTASVGAAGKDGDVLDQEPDELLDDDAEPLDETADFFLRLNHQGSKDETMIPGLNVFEKTPEEYEAELGKPKYTFPYSVPELHDDLSDQVKTILDNVSSSNVLKALVRILLLHKTEPVTFKVLKQRNPHLTDLNNIYNKALINLLSHDDVFRLITAVRIQPWLPELQLHPLILASLVKLHEELATDGN